MIYADEDFYARKFLLGKKPIIRDGFNYYAREASQIIDQYTFNRLAKVDRVSDEVKFCCCELAEQYFRTEKQKKEAGKTSEKVGTYSVTFASGADISNADASEKRSIVMKWLGNTGLCYRGI